MKPHFNFKFTETPPENVAYVEIALTIKLFADSGDTGVRTVTNIPLNTHMGVQMLN